MAKVKTLIDFHDKTDIDPKTGVGKVVPAGTTLDLSPERRAELAARNIVPKAGETEVAHPVAESGGAISNTK